MKRKNPSHPRLFLKIKPSASIIELFYKSNLFNSDGSRIINSLFYKKDVKNLKNDEYLIFLNQKEFLNLKKYIKIQKIVLEKHQKDRNYDAVSILNNSIIKMNDFKKEFEDWFLKMDVLSWILNGLHWCG